MTTLTRILAVLLFGATLFGISGCDVTSSNPVYDNGVRTQEFTPRSTDFFVNESSDIAWYEWTTNLLTPAVVDRGMVLLYARGDLVIIGEDNTWTALPFTQGIEPADGGAYVDFTITYTYAFDVDLLYLSVISSAVGLVDDYIPSGIPFRLVTIPPGTHMEGINLAQYADVAAAFNLEQ